MNYVADQLAFGPRVPGSDASVAFAKYLEDELGFFGWDVQRQEFIHKEVSLANIIARNSTKPPEILLGTHYDTRAHSDEDPDQAKTRIPVPGANDGASGTAILMELASLLAEDKRSIMLAFFDAEDQGRINGWDWSVGAQYFAGSLTVYPQEVIIIDMIGDADLTLYREANSSPAMSSVIWKIAKSLGYDEFFIDQEKYSIIDDHLPFINLGIPSILIIDMDYAFWHTTQDDLNNISKESLQTVGDVLLSYIRKSNRQIMLQRPLSGSLRGKMMR